MLNKRERSVMIYNQTLQVIQRRRSIRSYRPEQIKDEELQAVLEAGQWAPRSEDQVWHFTVVQNPLLLTRLVEAAKSYARESENEHLQHLGNDRHYNCLYGAPTLIIVSGRSRFNAIEWDCGAATQNMLIAAESLELGSCWTYFVLLAFDSNYSLALRSDLGIPQRYQPYAAIALGYKDKRSPSPDTQRNDIVTRII